MALSFTINIFIFDELNGTYTYTLNLPSGNTPSNIQESKSVSEVSSSATISAQLFTNYLLYVIIAIVVIIAVLNVVMVMRRDKEK